MNLTKRQSPAEILEEYLRTAGKRRTAERFAILARVGSLSAHFTAEALTDAMNEAGYHVSPTTVYSTLEILVDAGLVVRHRFADKATIYERAGSNNGGGHPHLVCTVCGKVKEMRDAELSHDIASKRYGSFEQQSFTLTIYGICGTCARRRRRAKLKN